ncbi:MAG: hypothetical protein COT14_01010 [Candidatus Diapherotrites archaeon CG08_land_8_20_14_0_20_30_16]|nr:MAG: hypothetical protein COT14_01010 [Candidatus Diapherotrites archaeon CG08_land_8_20_14_0_20_30_16]
MKITSGCIININNNLLLLKHLNGRYSIPEASLKENELLKVSCIKAIQEKTGFNIIPNAMLGVYDALDRKYPERTIGVYYIAHLDILQEHAEKLVQEFNASMSLKSKESKAIQDVESSFQKDAVSTHYELVLLSLVDIANQEYLYDHKTIMNNYFRILMLGSQTFTKKKEENDENKE